MRLRLHLLGQDIPRNRSVRSRIIRYGIGKTTCTGTFSHSHTLSLSLFCCWNRQLIRCKKTLTFSGCRHDKLRRDEGTEHGEQVRDGPHPLLLRGTVPGGHLHAEALHDDAPTAAALRHRSSSEPTMFSNW
jgi:hypothetical protein